MLAPRRITRFHDCNQFGQSSLVVLLKKAWIQVAKSVDHNEAQPSDRSEEPPSERRDGQHAGESNPMRHLGTSHAFTHFLQERQIATRREVNTLVDKP